MATVIVGLVSNAHQARGLIRALDDAGFSGEDIDMGGARRRQHRDGAGGAGRLEKAPARGWDGTGSVHGRSLMGESPKLGMRKSCLDGCGVAAEHFGAVQTAQQFICNKCRTLSNVQSFEQTRDGIFFCRCEHCETKNRIVRTGQSPSQPGLIPVTGVLQ